MTKRMKIKFHHMSQSYEYDDIIFSVWFSALCILRIHIAGY